MTFQKQVIEQIPHGDWVAVYDPYLGKTLGTGKFIGCEHDTFMLGEGCLEVFELKAVTRIDIVFIGDMSHLIYYDVELEDG